jgi:hypothetical protein
VFPAKLTYWQPFWLMIQVLLLQKHFVLFHVKLLPAKNGFHPKVFDSQMCMPVENGCQEEEKNCLTKLAPIQNGPPE